MRTKSASSKSPQSLTTLLMTHKSNKHRGAIEQTNLQIHISVHALSSFAENSSLCTLRPVLTGGPWPSYSIWGCSLLQEIHSASLLVFLFLPKPRKCLSSGGGYHRASMHGASMVQLSPRFCSSRELLSCKDHSSQKNISRGMRHAFLIVCHIIWTKMYLFVLSCILALWAATSQHDCFGFSW